jgi:hypothetical protein
MWFSTWISFKNPLLLQRAMVNLDGPNKPKRISNKAPFYIPAHRKAFRNQND